MRAVARPARTTGFTLLELLVVMVILGLLASYVGPKYFSQIGKSKRTVAKSQVEAFERALDAFRVDVGRYPNSDEGLSALVTRPALCLQKALDISICIPYRDGWMHRTRSSEP